MPGEAEPMPPIYVVWRQAAQIRQRWSVQTRANRRRTARMLLRRISLDESLLPPVMRAYRECNDEVQAAIREMVEIVNDPEATDDEAEAALLTIALALFPSSCKGSFGMDLQECEDRAPAEVKEVQSEMDRQEETFANRVSAAMESKKMTQADLAAASGVGQPAISMMLSRGGRPQKKTVERVAAALGMAPNELWPELESGQG